MIGCGNPRVPGGRSLAGMTNSSDFNHKDNP